MKRLLAWVRRHVAPVPPALAGCEFGCRATECAHGQWEGCIYRLTMQRLAELPSTERALVPVEDRGPTQAAGGG